MGIPEGHLGRPSYACTQIYPSNGTLNHSTLQLEIARPSKDSCVVCGRTSSERPKQASPSLMSNPLGRLGEAWKEAEFPYLSGKTHKSRLNQRVGGGKEPLANSTQEHGVLGCLAAGAHQPAQGDAWAGALHASNCRIDPWTPCREAKALNPQNTIPCTVGTSKLLLLRLEKLATDT